MGQRKRAKRKFAPLLLLGTAACITLALVLSTGQPQSQTARWHRDQVSQGDPFDVALSLSWQAKRDIPFYPMRDEQFVEQILAEKRLNEAVRVAKERAREFQPEIDRLRLKPSPNNYRYVEVGMTREQVVQLLGEPDKAPWPDMQDEMVYWLSKSRKDARRDVVVFGFSLDSSVHDRRGFDDGDKIGCFYPSWTVPDPGLTVQNKS